MDTTREAGGRRRSAVCLPYSTRFLIAVILLTGRASLGAPMLRFTDVTTSAGITFNYGAHADGESESHIGGGGAAEDFDGDGWIDLFIVKAGAGSVCHLYMNNRDGTFREEASTRGAALAEFDAGECGSSGAGVGAAAADYDNDGDIDIAVTFLCPPHVLLVNDGSGNFSVDSTMLTGPGFIATSPSWGDVDNDGLLELAIGQWNRITEPCDHELILYKNLGGGVLEPYSFRLFPGCDPLVFSPRFADLTGDGLADLAVTSDFGNSQIYINRGGGMFENTTDTAGIGFDRAGMGADIADYDDDGDLDWFVSSISINDGNVGNRLYNNRGNGVFDDITDSTGLNDGIWGWGAGFADFDQDGDQDIYHAAGWTFQPAFEDVPALLFENLGGGSFVDVAAFAGVDDDGEGRGLAIFDYDNDGDQDFIVMVNGAQDQPGHPFLYRNDTIDAGSWVKIAVQAEPPMHRNAIGARVHVTTGRQRQMKELNASTNFLAHGPNRIAHFGLGANDIIDEIRVEVLTGDASLMIDTPVDQFITIRAPAATVSNRTPAPGEPVEAHGAQAEPLGAPREWIIDGKTHADPVLYRFKDPGPAELRLNIYEPDGETLHHAELIRIEIQPGEPSRAIRWWTYR